MIAKDVVLGENVRIFQPDLVNLYGCSIGDGVATRARTPALKPAFSSSVGAAMPVVQDDENDGDRYQHAEDGDQDAQDGRQLPDQCICRFLLFNGRRRDPPYRIGCRRCPDAMSRIISSPIADHNRSDRHSCRPP